MNYVDLFNGNNTSTWFCLSGMPDNPAQVIVTIDGSPMYYGHNFVLNGYYLGFVDAPPEGQDNIRAEYSGTSYDH